MDDIPFIYWADDGSDHEDHENSMETKAATTGDDKTAPSPSKGDNPAGVEAKIDKMLELYMSLDKKIKRNTTTSKGKFSHLKCAYNNLGSIIRDQRGEIVDCYTRINDIKHAYMQAQGDLEKAKGLIFDLISTIGMLNSRVENLERLSHSDGQDGGGLTCSVERVRELMAVYTFRLD